MSHVVYRPHIHNKKHKGNLLDKFIYPIGLIAPIMTVPQLLDVWTHKGIQGISVPTWSAYSFVAGLWTIYGLYHKEKPIILANLLLLILDASIVTSVLLYKQ